MTTFVQDPADNQGAHPNEHQIAVATIIRGKPDDEVREAREHIEACPLCRDTVWKMENDLEKLILKGFGET